MRKTNQIYEDLRVDILMSLWDLAFDRLEKYQILIRNEEVDTKIRHTSRMLFQIKEEIQRRLMEQEEEKHGFRNIVEIRSRKEYVRERIEMIDDVLQKNKTGQSLTLKLKKHRDELKLLLNTWEGKAKL